MNVEVSLIVSGEHVSGITFTSKSYALTLIRDEVKRHVAHLLSDHPEFRDPSLVVEFELDGVTFKL